LYRWLPLLKPFFPTCSLPQKGHFRATKVITPTGLSCKKLSVTLMIPEKKINAMFSEYYQRFNGNFDEITG